MNIWEAYARDRIVCLDEGKRLKSKWGEENFGDGIICAVLQNELEMVKPITL